MNRVVTFHPYGLLTLCKIPEKSNDPIPRKLHYPWTHGWMVTAGGRDYGRVAYAGELVYPQTQTGRENSLIYTPNR